MSERVEEKTFSNVNSGATTRQKETEYIEGLLQSVANSSDEYYSKQQLINENEETRAIHEKELEEVRRFRQAALDAAASKPAINIVAKKELQSITKLSSNLKILPKIKRKAKELGNTSNKTQKTIIAPETPIILLQLGGYGSDTSDG